MYIIYRYICCRYKIPINSIIDTGLCNNIMHTIINNNLKKMLCTHRLKTRISFSSESSLPFKAFLSMTFMAYRSPGLSLLSANLTCEKAPLKNSSIYYMYIYFICI